MDQRHLSLLPMGTTSNEALHDEINDWFREAHKSSPEYALPHARQSWSRHRGAIPRPVELLGLG